MRAARADRLFLDANVLFTAAHRPQGKAAYLFAYLFERAARVERPDTGVPWTLFSSSYAIEEARRNVLVKVPQAIDGLDALLSRLTIAPQPVRAQVPLALPDKDAPIWSSALAARATHLLTGDLRDFGPHMNRPQRTAGVVIQTVAQYLDSW